MWASNKIFKVDRLIKTFENNVNIHLETCRKSNILKVERRRVNMFQPTDVGDYGTIRQNIRQKLFWYRRQYSALRPCLLKDIASFYNIVE